MKHRSRVVNNIMLFTFRVANSRSVDLDLIQIGRCIQLTLRRFKLAFKQLLCFSRASPNTPSVFFTCAVRALRVSCVAISNPERRYTYNTNLP